MADYYDPNPQRLPRIPIALVGFLGADQDVVATKLAALTGLNAHDVENLVIHRAGASTGKVFLDLGPSHYRALARECLETALADTPPGIISLPHGMLVEPEDRAMVVSKAALVYLHQDFEPMVRRVQSRVEERPGIYFPWIAPGEPCISTLEQLFEERREGYDAAMFHLNVTDRAAVDVARELVEQFDLWESDD